MKHFTPDRYSMQTDRINELMEKAADGLKMTLRVGMARKKAKPGSARIGDRLFLYGIGFPLPVGRW